jgi:serine/threonine protein phosphatase PrpC
MVKLLSRRLFANCSALGIEPTDLEEGGIHQKINQDRGCVVYPFNNSRDEALFLVLDGHGEHGDKVSDFVMKQVR